MLPLASRIQAASTITTSFPLAPERALADSARYSLASFDKFFVCHAGNRTTAANRFHATNRAEFQTDPLPCGYRIVTMRGDPRPPCIFQLPADAKPERRLVDGSPQPPRAIEAVKKQGAPPAGSAGNPNSRRGRRKRQFASPHAQGRVMEQPPTSPGKARKTCPQAHRPRQRPPQSTPDLDTKTRLIKSQPAAGQTMLSLDSPRRA
jgi:hypothetical protein